MVKGKGIEGGIMKQSITFNQILTRVASRNAEELMTRAQLANRLAKSLEGLARARAYRVKHHALAELTCKFPDRVTIKPDPDLPDFVVVVLDVAQSARLRKSEGEQTTSTIGRHIFGPREKARRAVEKRLRAVL